VAARDRKNFRSFRPVITLTRSGSELLCFLANKLVFAFENCLEEVRPAPHPLFPLDYESRRGPPTNHWRPAAAAGGRADMSKSSSPKPWSVWGTFFTCIREVHRCLIFVFRFFGLCYTFVTLCNSECFPCQLCIQPRRQEPIYPRNSQDNANSLMHNPMMQVPPDPHPIAPSAPPLPPPKRPCALGGFAACQCLGLPSV